MPRQRLSSGLARLQDEILALGQDVARAIRASVEALGSQDFGTARCLIQGDQRINERRFAIEAECLTLIATQQPMAGDLRTLAAVLELATELERTGDYAKGIARIVLLIGDRPLIKPLVDLPRMAEMASRMLLASLDAFVKRDVEAARAIPRQDDEVDALYNRVYRDLLALIIEDPRRIDQATHLLWAAHNLERAADRVSNICERTIFMVIGEMHELDSEFEAPRNGSQERT